MIKTQYFQEVKMRMLQQLEESGIIVTEKEKCNIEITDFGLGRIEQEGLGLVVYVNNEHYCAKDLVLLPNQICPEHKHPAIQNGPGKTETFRCRQGKVWLYVEGDPDSNVSIALPEESQRFYTVFNEIELNSGDQYTIPPNTLHWFRAGRNGAIISEFSTTSRDEHDMFTNPSIRR